MTVIVDFVSFCPHARCFHYSGGSCLCIVITRIVYTKRCNLSHLETELCLFCISVQQDAYRDMVSMKYDGVPGILISLLSL